MSLRFCYYFAFFFIFIDTSFAKLNIKLRAREHFVDGHSIQLSSTSKATYSGLSNTLNIWQEVPFKYSIGLSISPILGSPKASDVGNAPLGEKIKLEVYGIEGKYFPLNQLKGFLRMGLGYTKLKGAGNTGKYEGYSYYMGVGWEFPVWKIHLAPEFAFRKSNLSHEVTVNSTVVSLGVHFYEHL